MPPSPNASITQCLHHLMPLSPNASITQCLCTMLVSPFSSASTILPLCHCITNCHPFVSMLLSPNNSVIRSVAQHLHHPMPHHVASMKDVLWLSSLVSLTPAKFWAIGAH